MDRILLLVIGHPGRSKCHDLSELVISSLLLTWGRGFGWKDLLDRKLCFSDPSPLWPPFPSRVLRLGHGGAVPHGFLADLPG